MTLEIPNSNQTMFMEHPLGGKCFSGTIDIDKNEVNSLFQGMSNSAGTPLCQTLPIILVILI